MLPPRCLALALSAALGVGASGCGGSSSTPTVTVTNPTASVPRGSPPPPPDASGPGTNPATTPTRPKPSTITTEANQVQVRVPATYTVVDGRLQPPTITVPPFLAVEISVVAADGRAHRLVVRTPTPHRLAVQAGGHEGVRIPGLKSGRYAVELDGKAAGALLVGGDAGP